MAVVDMEKIGGNGTKKKTTGTTTKAASGSGQSAVSSKVNTVTGGTTPSVQQAVNSGYSAAQSKTPASGGASTIQSAVNQYVSSNVATPEEAAAARAEARAESKLQARAQLVAQQQAEAERQRQAEQQRAAEEAARIQAEQLAQQQAEQQRAAEAAAREKEQKQAAYIAQLVAQQQAEAERQRQAEQREYERQQAKADALAQQHYEEISRIGTEQQAEYSAAERTPAETPIVPQAPQISSGGILPKAIVGTEEANVYDAQQQYEYELWQRQQEEQKLAAQRAAEEAARLEAERQRQAEAEAKRQQTIPVTPSVAPTVTTTVTPSPSANGTGGGSAAAYTAAAQEPNGFSLTPDQIKELQERYMGIEPTGVWDEYTQSRANGETMEQWWNGYQAALGWDFGSYGSPSEEARKWAAKYAPDDYAQWLVDRGEAADLSEAWSIVRALTGTTSGSQSTSTGATSGNGYPSYTEDLLSLLRQQAAARIQSELAGLRGAYEQSMMGLDSEMNAIPSRYDSARRQLSEADIIARRAFDERALASGISSGARAQADLSRSNAYKNALAAIETSQAQAQDEVGLRQALLRAQYETDVQKAQYDNDAQLASDLYKEMVRLQEAQSKAASAAASSEKPALSAAQVNSAIKSGILTGNVLDAYEYYYGEPYGGTAAAATGTQYSSAGSGSVNNGSLTTAQIAELQNALGVSPDGLWGPKSRAAAQAAGYSTDADEAYRQLNAKSSGAGTGYTAAEIAAALAPTSTAANPGAQRITNVAQLGAAARSAYNAARSALSDPYNPSRNNDALRVVQSRAKDMTNAEYTYVLSALGLV